MFTQVVDQDLKGLFFQDGIGVEEQDHLSAGGSDTLIRGGGKAPVFAILNHQHLGEPPLHHLDRAVIGVIVHQDSLHAAVEIGPAQ
ncbi:hypothetical protein ES703_68087 [subsurface metagenome]